jgi:hypothetical protein
MGTVAENLIYVTNHSAKTTYTSNQEHRPKSSSLKSKYVYDRKTKDKIRTDTKSYKNAGLYFQSCGHITKEFQGIPLTVC